MKKIPLFKLRKFYKFLCVFIIAFISLSSYQYINVVNEFKKEQEHIEYHLLHSIYLVDEGYAMFEKVLDNQLEKQMHIFLEEYINNNRNVDTLDLEKIKKQFGTYYDLYIIDREGNIVHSTYKDDIGLNFKKWPSLFEKMKKLYESGEFFAYRIDIESSTNMLKKYVYQGSDDKKYIFQIGLSSDGFKNYIENLDLINVAENLSSINRNVEKIRIFDRDGWQRSFNKILPPNKDLKKIIRMVYKEKTIYEIKKKNKIYKYIYTDFKSKNSLNKVIEITYNTEKIHKQIVQNIIKTLTGVLISVILILMLSFVFFNLKSRMAIVLIIILLAMLIPIDSIIDKSKYFENRAISLIFFAGFFMVTLYVFYVIKKQFEQLKKVISFDKVTRLPNRYSLNSDLDALKKEKANYTIIAVYIENIREIFNIIGHHNGDLILKSIGKYLEKIKSDENAKIYNSYSLNFEIVLIDYEKIQINQWLENFRENVENKELNIGDYSLYLKTFIGVSFSNNIDECEKVIKQAYEAIDYAYKNEKEYYIYDSKIEKNLGTTYLVSQIKNALEKNEFYLEYQPKIKLKSGKIERVEALIRWKHPILGVIPPGEFIPKLEKTLSIRKVTWWVLERVLKDIKDWEKKGIKLSVSVNICQKDLSGRNFVKKVFELLEKHKVNPDFLELEITETDIITDKEGAIKVLSFLRTGGVKISIDDFGTGYSSLSYLNSLPIDFIKIDKSFIKDIAKSEKKQNLVKNTIDMSHVLGKGVIAEGVEDEETYYLLKELDCEQIQGFYIAKGMTKEKLEYFIKEKNKNTGSRV